jgi:hypothetical protein
LEIETICLVTQLSRSAPVKVKSAIQALSMLSSLALAMALAGCTEEAPPTTPAAAPGATAKPGGAGEKPAVPPVTTTKEEKK